MEGHKALLLCQVFKMRLVNLLLYQTGLCKLLINLQSFLP
jgi:hypothetical protein